MTSQPTPVPSSLRRNDYQSVWLTKFVECLLVAIAGINVVLEFLPHRLTMQLETAIQGSVFFIGIEAGILLGILFAIGWHYTEKRGKINSGLAHAWLRGILRYWLAFEIATYGFAKILRTQFAQVYHRDDIPVGQLNGFDLTWNYFAHSYTMAVIIAVFQIGGSILLLFRRTTLLGVAVLLPVMVNIVLINVFFHIAAGAFMNSILFTLGLIYILFLFRRQLRWLFWRGNTDLPIVKLGIWSYLLKLLIIGCAFGVIFFYFRTISAGPLAGKWKVDQLIRDRDTAKTNDWLTNSEAWCTVYLEQYGGLALDPNPYIFDRDRSLQGQYSYNESKKQLLLIIDRKPYPNDTITASVSGYDGNKMQLKGIFVKDTLQLRLSRAQDVTGR